MESAFQVAACSACAKPQDALPQVMRALTSASKAPRAAAQDGRRISDQETLRGLSQLTPMPQGYLLPISTAHTGPGLICVWQGVQFVDDEDLVLAGEYDHEFVAAVPRGGHVDWLLDVETNVDTPL